MLAIGIALGTFTGLVPGVHANTIAFIALYSPLEKNLGFALLIVSMSITHSFVDTIPNILLGAPSEETFLAILPGHRMLMRGKGLEAIDLTIHGGLIATVFSLMLMPFFFSFAQKYGEQLPIAIPGVLTGVLLLMVLSEKNILGAVAVAGLSALLGLVTLSSGIREPILVLVIGFFALPSLLQAAGTGATIPEQEKAVMKKAHVKTGLIAAIASGIISVFPGIGPSQAALAVMHLHGRITEKGYLVLVGGINTANLLFSLLMLFALEKTRTGMALAIKNTLEPDFGTTLTLISGAILAAGMAALITREAAKAALTALRKMDYTKTSLLIAAGLGLLVALLAGVPGIAACASACGISLFGAMSRVRRSECMSFLMAPTIFYYLGIGF